MKYAKAEDCYLGDIISVPIDGEYMQDEQICQSYEVVKALKCRTPQSEQIVAKGEQPMPLLLEFTDQTGFLVGRNANPNRKKE